MFASTDRNKVAQPPLWSGSDVPSLVLRHLNGAGVTATRWRGQRSGVAAAGSLRSAHAEFWRGCGQVSPHAGAGPSGRTGRVRKRTFKGQRPDRPAGPILKAVAASTRRKGAQQHAGSD